MISRFTGMFDEMVVFETLFVLSFLLFPSEGQITSPPDGSNMTVLPGENVTITWSFSNDVAQLVSRAWYFTSGDGSFVDEPLASIIRDGQPQIDPSGLSGVSIVKPATLLLKNVNQTYNGTYQFDLSGRGGSGLSQVVVIIARKPTVTINCSSSITVDEDHDLICLCKGENGNPPADVIWYDKNGNPIGRKEKENKILVLRSVTEADSGTYTCKAQSHTLMDEKSIEVKVSLNYKPTKTDIEFSSNPAIIGNEVTITCSSNGQSKPSFTIIHNGTINISGIEETYTISKVNWDDAGYYTCVAIYKLGSHPSDSRILNVTVKEKPTVTINCSNPITVDEDHDLICLCKGENGNPPADVIWFDSKGNGIGQKEKEEKILVIRSVTEADSGTYTCKAQSHTLMDEKPIDVKVPRNYKPIDTDIKLTTNPAI